MRQFALNAWAFAQSLLKIRGQSMAGLFTLTIIGLAAYVTLRSPQGDIPNGVQNVYLTFVGAYGINKTVELFQPKNKQKKEQGE